MAIQTTQSTAQLLAAQNIANRKAAEQAQLVVPQQSNLTGSNAFSMMTSGINQAANAYNNPETTQAEQANLKRANAIRLSDELKEAQKTAFDQGQRQFTTDNIKEDRRANISGMQGQVAMNTDIAAIDAEQNKKLAEQSKLLGTDLKDVANVQAFSQIDEYNKMIETGTASNIVSDFASKVLVLKEAGAFKKFTGDLNDVTSRAKKAFEGGKDIKWLPQYAEIIKGKILNNATVDAGWFGIDGDLLKEDDMVQLFKDEMIQLNMNLKNKKAYDSTVAPFNARRNAAAIKAASKAIPRY